MSQVEEKLLRSIQKHDGEWGWYQLDRMVNPRNLPEGMTAMDVLNVLETDGLIIQRPSAPQNKYQITDAGRIALLKAAA